MVTTAATTASAESAGNSAVAEAPAVPAAMGAGLGRKDAKRKCKKEEDSSKSTVEPEPEAAAEITADHAVRSAAEPVDAAACASELAAGSSSSSGGHGGGWDGVNSAAGRVDTPSAIAPPCAAPLPPTVPPLPHAVPDAVVITVVKALERIEAALAAEQSRARVIDVQIQRLEGQVSAVHGTLGRTMALLQQMSERMLPSAAPERSALALGAAYGAAEPHAITPRPQLSGWASPLAAIDEVMFAAEATIAPARAPAAAAATTTTPPLTADSVDDSGTLTEAQRQKIEESRRQALARRQGVRYPPAGGTAGSAPLAAGMQPPPLTVGAGPATTAQAAGPFAVAAAATAGTSYNAPLPGTLSAAPLLPVPRGPPAPAPPPLTPAQHVELATARATAHATAHQIAAERRKAAELLGLETVATNPAQDIQGQKAFKRPRPYSHPYSGMAA